MNWNVIMALIGGLAGGLMLSGMGQQKGQQPQAPQALELPPTQMQQDPAQTPDYNALLKANQGAARSGPSAGMSSTFKSGPKGVDPNSLALGTNMLLGS